jgi:hypothetical protein
MKNIFVALTVCTLAIPALVQSAEAKGCIKGEIVGGAAGHYMGHHGYLGAAAGCLIGRHQANKRARMETTGQPANPPYRQPPNYQYR